MPSDNAKTINNVTDERKDSKAFDVLGLDADIVPDDVVR